jgi:hypothetical protein
MKIPSDNIHNRARAWREKGKSHICPPDFVKKKIKNKAIYHIQILQIIISELFFYAQYYRLVGCFIPVAPTWNIGHT